MRAVFGNEDDDMNAIIDSATNIDRNNRFRNLQDLEKVILNPENILAFIPLPIAKNKYFSEQKLSSKDRPNQQRTGESKRSDTATANKQAQSDKNVFQIANEIENQNKPETAAQDKQQASSTNSTKQQQNSDYERTREAIRQVAQQSQQTSGSKSVNTTSVVVLGVLSIIFSFISPFFGLGLAIFGFRSAAKNKAKAKLLGRRLLSNELNTQSIGFVFCVIGLLISIVKFFNLFGDMVL